MAFIDADEFFVIKDGTPSLPALLREYEDFGGLAVNWQVGFATVLLCLDCKTKGPGMPCSTMPLF